MAGMRFSPCVALATAGVLTLTLGGCGKTNDTQEETDNSGNQVFIDDTSLRLVAENYPLQYVLEQVAGDGFRIGSLTTGASNAHTVKLSQTARQNASKANLVLTMSGYNPSVDQAVKGRKNVMTVNSLANLKQHGGTTDYRFWLDPARMTAVSDAVAKKLGELDPPRANTYTQNAQALDKELLTLDNVMTMTLATCRIKPVFTERPDFAYLAEGTTLTPRALLSGTGKQGAAVLARKVAATNATTIYAEPNSRTTLMQAVADASGTSVGTLDPMDTLGGQSVGDYLDGMNANLKVLTKGQKCKAPANGNNPGADDTAEEDAGD